MLFGEELVYLMILGLSFKLRLILVYLLIFKLRLILVYLLIIKLRLIFQQAFQQRPVVDFLQAWQFHLDFGQNFNLLILVFTLI